MDENKRAAERALIAGPAKHLAEIISKEFQDRAKSDPLTFGEWSFMVGSTASHDGYLSYCERFFNEVAEVRRPTQGAASGADNLPASGAASGPGQRPLDLEAIDYDEMRRQINSEHQGPWFRARAYTDTMGCDSYAVLVCEETKDITTVVLLGCADEVVGVLLPDVVPERVAYDVGYQAQTQIEKQKQCRAECRRVGCGCQC